MFVFHDPLQIPDRVLHYCSKSPPCKPIHQTVLSSCMLPFDLSLKPALRFAEVLLHAQCVTLLKPSYQSLDIKIYIKLHQTYMYLIALLDKFPNAAFAQHLLLPVACSYDASRTAEASTPAIVFNGMLIKINWIKMWYTLFYFNPKVLLQAILSIDQIKNATWSCRNVWLHQTRYIMNTRQDAYIPWELLTPLHLNKKKP